MRERPIDRIRPLCPQARRSMCCVVEASASAAPCSAGRRSSSLASSRLHLREDALIHRGISTFARVVGDRRGCSTSCSRSTRPLRCCWCGERVLGGQRCRPTSGRGGRSCRRSRPSATAGPASTSVHEARDGRRANPGRRDGRSYARAELVVVAVLDARGLGGTLSDARRHTRASRAGPPWRSSSFTRRVAAVALGPHVERRPSAWRSGSSATPPAQASVASRC